MAVPRWLSLLMHIFWRDTTSYLWTLVLFSYTIYNCFNSFPHSFGHWSYFTLIIFYIAHLILCVQEAEEIDILSVLLGQSSLSVIVCKSTSIVVNGAINTLLSLLQVLLVR